MKKMILAAMVLVTLVSGAFAADEMEKFPEDAIGVSFITKADVKTTVRWMPPTCPSGALCDPATLVIIDMKLPQVGCMDVLGPVGYEYRYDRENKILNVYVSAINITTKRSTQVMCLMEKMTEKTIKIYGPMYWYGEIKEVNVELIREHKQY